MDCWIGKTVELYSKISLRILYALAISIGRLLFVPLLDLPFRGHIPGNYPQDIVTQYKPLLNLQEAEIFLGFDLYNSVFLFC